MWLTQITPYEVMGLAIMLQAVVMIFLMAIIMIRKFYIASREKFTNAKKDHHRSMILKVIDGDEIRLVQDLDKNSLLDVRNIICDMTPALKGDSFERVQRLYCDLSMNDTDIKALKHIDSDKRLRALNRLEKLKLSIPYDLHLSLLDDSNEVMRLLATLLLIHNHKKRATPVLISFIEQKKYGKKGFLFYIIQEIGKVDRAALPFLFERAIDSDIEEAILVSANISPPPQFDEVIYRKLTLKSAPFVIVWSVRVLMHYPSQRLFSLIEVLMTHPFWAVRLEVVRTLHLFESSSVSPLLELFIKDENYLVRLEATNYAVRDLDSNKNLLNKIILDEAHPAKDILHNLFSTEDLKAS